jgi:hypothetical protein
MICIQQNLTDNFDEKSFNGTKKKKKMYTQIYFLAGVIHETRGLSRSCALLRCKFVTECTFFFRRVRVSTFRYIFRSVHMNEVVG